LLANHIGLEVVPFVVAYTAPFPVVKYFHVSCAYDIAIKSRAYVFPIATCRNKEEIIGLQTFDLSWKALSHWHNNIPTISMRNLI